MPWTTLMKCTWRDRIPTLQSILWLWFSQEECSRLWRLVRPRGRGSCGDQSVCQDACGREASTRRSVICSVHENVLMKDLNTKLTIQRWLSSQFSNMECSVYIYLDNCLIVDIYIKILWLLILMKSHVTKCHHNITYYIYPKQFSIQFRSISM